MEISMHPAHLPRPVMPRCPPQRMLGGQTALVTGASSGIGRAIALALGQAGADVVVNYVAGDDKAEQVCREIRDFDVQAVAIKADVSDEDQVLRMFAQKFERFGTIDLLVNNAGLQQDAPFEQLTLQQWNKVIGSISPDRSSAHARRSANSNAAAYGPTCRARPARFFASARCTK